ncbi:F-type H+-transporting ATPase subunit epsilon [Trueperella bonasi]|uniref:F-type H+-transporting ATPase subunit epsilon n=1 Tax=Trueperella bonasi TaxID=312286 RepID=A0ABT9NHU4_9ACTO|nr:F0F1 ATP synthase subunit epsilon [Trueperella bonasi]MDP9806757.1 F-type H+-transporting ATPase subunit epsilon [Trueperella bonasi]
MKLEVVARGGVLFEGEVSDVVVPAFHGEMGILPGRAPVMAVVRQGEVRFTENGQKNSVEVGDGFLTVDDDHVIVVVENYDVKRGAYDPSPLADTLEE